ncbi:hypothetical protein [Nocardiopsis composta]|uniref:Uncharacterized protein n=1 Tax=Nocardiopsis composta TaxID=157465 RepID=A0A7W8QN31_9ACTN|nr:hypothetical protein [Nocardiopsis composta]MBB5432825.1 hypothetical protein [Nocardiopsis composta]
MGKHEEKKEGDGQWPRPVPPPAPDDGGSGGGRHERDGEDK